MVNKKTFKNLKNPGGLKELRRRNQALRNKQAAVQVVVSAQRAESLREGVVIRELQDEIAGLRSAHKALNRQLTSEAAVERAREAARGRECQHKCCGCLGQVRCYVDMGDG